MTESLARQITAIEEGLRLRQWASHPSAIIVTLITEIRRQDAEIERWKKAVLESAP